MRNVAYMFLAFLWMILWIGISNWFEANWAFWVGMLGAAYLVGITLVMIVYAWIINPIREWKDRKKLK